MKSYKESVLVTGGLGYLGSHTVVSLLSNNYSVIIIDNLVNSNYIVLDCIKKITGASPLFYEGDIRDTNFLNNIFDVHKIQSVIHFAGIKDVPESFQNPTAYFSNNVAGSISLFKAMEKNNVSTLIFSSSANVYGDPIETPITEDHPINPTNPYGITKWMVEQILQNIKIAKPFWKIACLRYFNPLGAHSSGLIGEPSGLSKTNIMSAICRSACFANQPISIYGNDYPTIDGTPIRDFIHVEDLAAGHIFALEYLLDSKELKEPLVINLGTGIPTTILQLIRAFSDATGINVSFEFKPRREGDISVSYTNPNKANQLLLWQANKTIKKMCEDAWRWKLYESNYNLK